MHRTIYKLLEADWAASCADAMLRRCPVCERNSIVGHGRRRKQAHDEHHDWISIRRGRCTGCGQRTSASACSIAPAVSLSPNKPRFVLCYAHRIAAVVTDAATKTLGHSKANSRESLLSEYRRSIPISATNRQLVLLLGLSTFRSIRLST